MSAHHLENRTPLTPEQRALAESQVDLVESMVIRYVARRPRLRRRADELRSLAFLALVEAARSFDAAKLAPDNKVREFRDYVAFRLQREIGGLNRAESEMPFRISRGAYRDGRRILAAAERLRAEGREPSRAECLAAAGIPPELSGKGLDAAAAIVRLDGGVQQVSRVAEFRARWNPVRLEIAAPDDRDADRVDTRDLIDRMLACLKPRDRAIVRLYFGLDGEPLEMRKIAEVFRMTASNVSRVVTQALGQLRDHSDTHLIGGAA